MWAADVTYIPMACGFLYLVAIIDWASRAVLAWRLSNTNDASFCAAALEEALLRFGKPRIFNTDQGSTFTAEAFAGKLAAAGVAISMDGRGRFMDNIFIERLWRSIKYEEVHLKAYADGREARLGNDSWMNFYNFRRPQQAMNNQMPMDGMARPAWTKSRRRRALWICRFALDNAERVAHIPTAEAEAEISADSSKYRGRPDYTLNPTTPGPANGVQFRSASESLRRWLRGAVRHQLLDELLRFRPAPGDEQPNADGGVARRHGQNRGGRTSCGYAASLGQRKRVAHIPTAEAEAERCS